MEIPQQKSVFFEIGPFQEKKPCSLAGCENAQKIYSLHYFCRIGSLPAPAMSEIFTQIMGGPESGRGIFKKPEGSARRNALLGPYVGNRKGSVPFSAREAIPSGNDTFPV